MNVSLTVDLEKWIGKKVSGGLYQSASEVVREGLRALKSQEMEKKSKLESLREEIRVGLEQADRGRLMPLDVKSLKSKIRKNLSKKP